MLTQSKAFCSCSTTFGNEPNTSVCPVCLGMPGVLPVLNRSLVDFVIRMGLAVECVIAPRSVFARKNYFYPDLPKGYQISQYDSPICSNGSLVIELDDGSQRRIGILRIHMEEDAGKSIHDQNADTLVDVNRCGVPLIEIVSEPDMRSPREAHHYLLRIRQLLTYLGICDGNMEEGSFRCDANVSVRPCGETVLGTKTEVKNMNSFRNVERALEFEIRRQTRLLEDGGRVVQETLLWDADRGVAMPMRSKEEAHDYRYFPDPDLGPVLVDERWIADVRALLPELPVSRRDRFIGQFGLPRYDADVLTAEKGVADYFETGVAALSCISTADRRENAKAVSNWVMTEVLRVVGEKHIPVDDFPVSPERLAAMIALIRNGTISGKTAKGVFEEMLSSRDTPMQIVERRGLLQVSDSAAIGLVVARVIETFPAQVQKYLDGNEKLSGFFVGEVMKETGGRANPGIVNELLQRTLASLKR
jgi:aspartyl-tRNA(Asn)/glutamyl-tRNA(Gln) amidotransferase subunit B